MRSPLILGPLLAILAGCATTGQTYREIVYKDGYTETIVKNRTVAPPFGSKAATQHRFDVTVNEDGSYVLGIGSEGALEGGDITALVEAVSRAVTEAVIRTLVPVPPGPLEPLREP